MIASEVIIKPIREFVLHHFPLAQQWQVNDEDSLLDNGIVDSLGILELVKFVEKEFEIVVLDEELLPDNFESISGLALFVEKKKDGVK